MIIDYALLFDYPVILHIPCSLSLSNPTDRQYLEMKLLLPSLNTNLRKRIRIHPQPRLPHSGRIPFRQAEVVLQQDMAQGNLDLVSSEEASRASVFSKAKSHMFWGRRDELGRGLAAGNLAQL